MKSRIPTRPQKFLGIQALRALAALLVVVTHSTFYTFERLNRQSPVWLEGRRGVDIFFVISGFVMIYASQKLLSPTSGWRVFTEQRIARIVPLYWLVTTLKVLLVLFTARLELHTILTPVTVVCSYLFLPSQNLDGRVEPLVGVGWTLSFEMFFYFIFALALYLRKNIFFFVGTVLIALSLVACFREPSWPAATAYFNPLVLEFFFGMLIAKACISDFYIPRKATFPLFILGMILLLMPTLEGPLSKFLVCGLPASLAVWSAASIGSMQNRIPRFILYLGDASFSIYLIHPFLCPLVPSVLNRLHRNDPWLSVTLSFVLGVSGGCLLHRFVEIPIIDRFRRRLKVRHEPLLHSPEAVLVSPGY